VYLGKPELTAAAVLTDPFLTGRQNVLTGDASCKAFRSISLGGKWRAPACKKLSLAAIPPKAKQTVVRPL